MNIRTLSKEDTIHVVNLSCMVIAWGLSSFYFDAAAPNKAVIALADALLSPFLFADWLSVTFLHYSLSGNFLAVFVVIWITYFLLGIKLSNLLMVKDHKETELKNWYFARKSHQ